MIEKELIIPDYAITMTIESLPIYLLSFCAAYYIIVTFGLILGLRRLRYEKSKSTPSVSIIVAARNEEANIARLLTQLVNQQYPNFEIIIVNDRSTDRTADIIGSFQSVHSHLRRIDISELPSDMPAKKHALAEGIRLSKGEILCFTDADCLPTSRWVSELVSCFSPAVGLVAGYSPYDSTLVSNPKTHSAQFSFLKRYFHKFIAYEEFKGGTWAGGSIGLRLSWLCTGRNLAYRRAVYDEVGGFEKIKRSIGGDDDLFLQLVRRETSWQIRYATARDSFVRTFPPDSLKAFVEQRKRHFSAGQFFTFPMKIFFLVYHASNLALFLAILWFFISSQPFSIGLIVFTLKVAADVTLYLTAAKTFHQYAFGVHFLFMEILYILYNTFIGPLGFITKFQWKPEQRS